MYKPSNTEQYIQSRALDVFDKYIGECYKGGRVKTKALISNPLISRRQETPSFNVFKSNLGIYLYNDFATEDKGDCIKLVQHLRNLHSRKDAVELIKSEMMIGKFYGIH